MTSPSPSHPFLEVPELLELILIHLSPDELILSTRTVCRQWNHLITQTSSTLRWHTFRCSEPLPPGRRLPSQTEQLPPKRSINNLPNYSRFDLSPAVIPLVKKWWTEISSLEEVTKETATPICEKYDEVIARSGMVLCRPGRAHFIAYLTNNGFHMDSESRESLVEHKADVKWEDCERCLGPGKEVTKGRGLLFGALIGAFVAYKRTLNVSASWGSRINVQLSIICAKPQKDDRHSLARSSWVIQLGKKEVGENEVKVRVRRYPTWIMDEKEPGT